MADVFMNGGKVRSPVPQVDVKPAADGFGVTVSATREQLDARMAACCFSLKTMLGDIGPISIRPLVMPLRAMLRARLNR